MPSPFRPPFIARRDAAEEAVPRILVVDDDRTTRELIRMQLRSAGHAVETAADGAAALARIGRKKFDLVLLDVWMPGMDGLEMLARLRDEPSRPKVVVMTADDTSETVLRAIRERACRYVTKPIEPRELTELVREVIADPRDVRSQVGQAFRELLTNAIEWGGRLDPNQTVRISCLRARRMLLYRIADPGKGFRVESLAHAAISNPPDRPMAHALAREEKGLRPGGFGLLMTRQMVDELLYNEAHNEVVFVKYLD